jgi:hypothetical protein
VNPKLNGEFIYNGNINIGYVIGILNQIDDKWFTMLENVIPSTMIWGEIKLIGDDFLSLNKYGYKKNTTYFNDSEVDNVDVLKNTTLGEIIITDTSLNIKNDKKFTNNNIKITDLNQNSIFSGYWKQITNN